MTPLQAYVLLFKDAAPGEQAPDRESARLDKLHAYNAEAGRRGEAAVVPQWLFPYLPRAKR